MLTSFFNAVKIDNAFVTKKYMSIRASFSCENGISYYSSSERNSKELLSIEVAMGNRRVVQFVSIFRKLL